MRHYLHQVQSIQNLIALTLFSVTSIFGQSIQETGSRISTGESSVKIQDNVGQVFVGAFSDGSATLQEGFFYLADTTKPTVILEDDDVDNRINNLGEILLTATFSEPMIKPSLNIGGILIEEFTNGYENNTVWEYIWDIDDFEFIDGEYSFSVAGTDLSGNAYVGTDSITFIVDNTPPTVQILSDDSDAILMDYDETLISAIFSEAMTATPTISIGNTIIDLPFTANQSGTLWTYIWDVDDYNFPFGEQNISVSGQDLTGNQLTGNESITLSYRALEATFEALPSNDLVKQYDEIQILAKFNHELYANPYITIQYADGASSTIELYPSTSLNTSTIGGNASPQSYDISNTTMNIGFDLNEGSTFGNSTNDWSYLWIPTNQTYLGSVTINLYWEDYNGKPMQSLTPLRFELITGDADADGVLDKFDGCPNTPVEEAVDPTTGCSASQTDSDQDGIMDDMDICPETILDEAYEVDEQGCAPYQIDTDGDEIPDYLDACPDTEEGAEVNEEGCSIDQIDTDEDGVADYLDNCVDTPNPEQFDQDGDGIGNVCDPDPSIEYIALEVSENASPTTPVVLFSAFNSNQDTITLTLSDTSGLFELLGENTIILVGELDFETNEFHIVELTATTENGGVATASITIMVSDIPNATYTGKFFISIFDSPDESKANKVDHTRYFNPFNKGVGKWKVRKKVSGGADAALFTIRGGGSSNTNDASAKNDDESEGYLDFINPPDFENPQDHNGDNIYEVEVTYENTDDGAREVPVPVTQRNIQIPENSTRAIELQSTPALPEDDSDNDGVPDIVDNSPLTFNPNQVDEDGDGVGDVSDDFDHDGVWNPYDNCPDTPLGEVVDENGCIIFYTVANNFSVSKTEKCAGEHQIALEIENWNLFNYRVQVNGPGTAVERNMDGRRFRLSQLDAGNYRICVTVNGIPASEFERCFNVQLSNPEGLEILTQFNPGDEVVNFQLKGGTNFTIVHNGKTIQTSDSNYALRLAKGVNKVRITNGIECQGVYERTFMNSYDVTVAPNPVQEQMQLFVGGSDTEALVEIFTSDGKQVFGQVFSLSPVNRNIKVDTHTLTEGTYYVKVQASTVKQSKLMIKE